MKRPGAMMIAIAAMMIAVTTVFTLMIRVPVPATQGYINFSDVAIYFASAAFGPWVGLVAGGLGAALADILGGYAQFAPLTFLAHGLQGLVAGALARRSVRPAVLIVAWLAGTLVMVGAYFLGEGLVLTGWGPAIIEAPFNLLQNVVGGLIGIPLYFAVRKAYPPVARLGRGPTWREE